MVAKASSRKYFIHIQDENKFYNIPVYKGYRNEE